MPNDKKLSEFAAIPSAAQLNSNKKVGSEVKRFSPSAIVTLYEIDVENILIDKNIPYDSGDTGNRVDAVFRFHNNLKLINQDIYWKGQAYRALPIKVDGFETSTRGALPTPKMTIFFNDKDFAFLSYFRLQVRRSDDLIGAKVTRVRTFARYLDEENFFTRGIDGTKMPRGNIDLILPENFEPDPNAEFPREIYYIERKSSEDIRAIQFELASIIDFENVKLPRRLILASTCNFTYRGEGCLYEAVDISKTYTSAEDRADITETFGSDNIKLLNLPSKALPVATENDEIIAELIPSYSSSNIIQKWDSKTEYNVGEIVFIEKRGIKNYFVAKQQIPINRSLGETAYWAGDKCSKSIKGCKLRWSDNTRTSNKVYGANISMGGINAVGSASRTDASLVAIVGNGQTHGGGLPFGGFPGVNKAQ